jgi:hypothetical protein
MRTFIIGAVAVLTLGVAGAAVAEEKLSVSPIASERVSGETIRIRLESMGYRVDRLEAEHDCWKARAVNDSGFPIKVKYDRATGELIQAKLR